MPKKKVFVARNLKDYLPNLPLKREKAKKKSKSFFIATILCFPEYEDIRTVIHGLVFNCLAVTYSFKSIARSDTLN